MNRIVFWLIAIVAVASFCWVLPPFRIRSLAEIKAVRAGDRFNAAEFADRFWNERLLSSLHQAADAEKVMDAIASNPREAREQFGRTVGISSSYCLFLRGAGRVVNLDEESVGLSLKEQGNEVDVAVPLGLVFGNAVRDGTGLLQASSFPNSQEFNEISARLNEMVETKVLPELRRIATVGKSVRFAGCVEVGDEEADLKPLRLVPVSVTLE